MIIDNSGKFIIFDLSNGNDKIVSTIIESFIFNTKHTSVGSCGSATNSSFISGSNYLCIMISHDAFTDIIRDMFGNIIDKTNEVAIYTKMTDPVFLNLISAYCLIKEQVHCYEIWDVCVFSEERGKNIGTQFINILLQVPFAVRKNFWLVVLPNNTRAAKTYTKNGFKIDLATKTNSIGQPMGFIKPVISFTYILGNSLTPIASAVDIEVKNFETVSKLIEEDLIKNTLHIAFSPDTLRLVKSMVEDLLVINEIGGGIQFTSTIIRNGITYNVFDFNNQVTKGTQTYVIPKHIEQNPFFFHSHPDSIKENFNGLIVQTPSILDLKATLNLLINQTIYNIKTSISFTFCHKAVFVTRFTSDFSDFVHKISKLNNTLFSIIQPSIDIIDAQIYHKSIHFNNDLLKKMFTEIDGVDNCSQIVKLKLRKFTAEYFCKKLNQLSIQDILLNASPDNKATLLKIIDVYKRLKDIQFEPSVTLFNVSYHEITNIDDGLFIECEDIDAPMDPILLDVTQGSQNPGPPVNYQNLNDIKLILSTTHEHDTFLLSTTV